MEIRAPESAVGRLEGCSEVPASRRLLPTRRDVVLGIVFVLLHPRFAFAASDPAAGVETDRRVIAALVDVFLPAHASNAGGLALGVDAKIDEILHPEGQRNSGLRMLSYYLGSEEFLALSAERRSERVRKHMQESAISKPLRVFLDVCLREYYTDPRSWTSIGYRTPQPTGYPEYADCPADGRKIEPRG